MIVLELNAKSCMAHLLLRPTFHSFSFIEGEVTTYNKFHIDGCLHKDFFDEAPTREYSSWQEIQAHFLAIIRGKRTPLNFKIILSLAKEDFAAFLNKSGLSFRPEDIQGLYLNFRYDGTQLECITGISMNTFTLDKSLEQEWDKYVRRFFIEMIET